MEVRGCGVDCHAGPAVGPLLSECTNHEHRHILGHGAAREALATTHGDSASRGRRAGRKGQDHSRCVSADAQCADQRVQPEIESRAAHGIVVGRRRTNPGRAARDGCSGRRSSREDACAKFRHYLYEWLGVDKVELAVMAELLLRGEQTIGELRGHASRMEPIPDLNALRPILESLEQKQLVVMLTPAGAARSSLTISTPPSGWQNSRPNLPRDTTRLSRTRPEHQVDACRVSRRNNSPPWKPQSLSCAARGRDTRATN